MAWVYVFLTIFTLNAAHAEENRSTLLNSTDAYEIFHVNRGVEDKKAAFNGSFRNLMKQFHPDTHPGDKEAEAICKRLSAIISDLKKKNYDPSRIVIEAPPRPERKGPSARNSSASAASKPGTNRRNYQGTNGGYSEQSRNESNFSDRGCSQSYAKMKSVYKYGGLGALGIIAVGSLRGGKSGDRENDEDKAIIDLLKKGQDPKNPSSEFKPSALRALEHSRWDIRRLAIIALGKTHLTTEEQNAILGKIEDSDSDVRGEAIKLFNSFPLSSVNAAVLINLLKDERWYVRRDVVSLLEQINDTASNAALIGELNDSDRDVSREAYNVLARRNITSALAPELSKILRSDQWEARMRAVELLGKIPGDEVSIKLIPMLADSDRDVQQEIYNQLKNRSLTENIVPAIKGNFSSYSSSTRQMAALLLGRIKGDSSLNALLNQLEVETDADVKRQIIASIALVRGAVR